jgi:tetratricopeptide (TPR) repeat protein
MAQPAAAPAKSDQPGPAAQAAAERRLKEALRRAPRSVEAHQALAAFYLHQGRLDAAISHLESVQVIDPSHYANAYDLAVALLQAGNLAGARQQVGRALGLKETAELHNLLGDIEERQGNALAAAEAYQRAAHMDGTEEHLFDWGNNLVQLRAFDPAVQVFATAVERHPRSARLHIGLGIAEYSRGRYPEAIRALCEAVDLAPSDPRGYQFLGEMYGVAPELSAEITGRLERFVKARPRNALGYLYYALSLWKGGTSESSPALLRTVEALLRRAVALDPGLAKGFLELGILLSDQERYKEAIVHLRRATELDPNQPQAHYRLGQAYQRTGQPALAAAELETFKRLSAGSR